MASRRVTSLALTTRTLLQAQRPGVRNAFAHRRFYASESSQQSLQGSNHTTAGIIGGVAGASLVFLGGYSYYHFSGAKTAVNLFHKGNSYFHHTSKQIQDSAPEPNEALQWLRSAAQSYATFIPGAKGYVDQAFDDLDAVHSKHGSEVDEIVSNTYSKLKSVTKDRGMSLDTAGEASSILGGALEQIMHLAGDAAEDLMNNHPKLKEQLGGNIDQLKEMGNKYGPEAKKQVDETWDQVRSILSKGFAVSTIPEIKKLVQDKSEQIQKVGNEMFDKGIESVKPQLEKVPKAKELVEQNKEQLKGGDLSTLWKKISEAATSGSTEDLESFVNSTVDQAKQKGQQAGGGGLVQYLSKIPGGDDMFSKLGKLQEIGQKHGKEAEDLLNSTIKDIQSLLQKKMEHAEDIAKKGKQDAEK